MSLAVVLSRGLAGLEAPLVTVEVHLAGGLPAFNLVGLPETEVKESRDRVRAALQNAQFDFPARKITVQWLYNSLSVKWNFGLTNRLRREFAALALTQRLPTVGWHRDQVEAGILMTYGPNNDDIFRLVAIYVDKVLRGAKPADLSVEQPAKFDLVINLNTAKALGLSVPQSLLLQAEAVQ